MAASQITSKLSGILSSADRMLRARVAKLIFWRKKSGQAPFPARVPKRSVAIKRAIKRFLTPDEDGAAGSFDPLTPARLHGESYERYSAELQRALSLPKVRNVAVTGSYGAGKSSFIQSFAADHPEYNYCFVSLAAFTQQASEDAAPPGAESGGNQEQSFERAGEVEPIERIEASIVQQLLYSVEDSSIPQTRLKRINHVHAGVAALYSIFAISVGVALLRIFGLPEGLAGLAGTFPLAQILAAEPSICIVAVIFAAVLVAQRVLSLLLGFRLQGITVKGVALAHSSVSSVLHKQLDEIVYLFERNKKDVVLIEDLDRFRDSSPFTRLREINFILNTSPGITRPIHFIYMIRDDVFSAADRVKFFDYVIPIISVINTDNSKQKMLDMMSERGWSAAQRPGADLVEAVSYYVDDMRQLVNILNEYDLFKAIVGGQQKLNLDKIFSAVVTKCLFPRHYAELLKGQGEIYELIHSYTQWSEGRVRELRSSIAELEAKVSSNGFDLARSERELRALVWMAAADRHASEALQAITPSFGNRLTFSEFVASELIGSKTDQNDHFELHYERTTHAVAFRELAGQGGGSIAARMKSARGIADGALQQLSVMRQKLAVGRYASLSQAVADSEFVRYIATTANARMLGPVGYFISNGFLGEDYFDFSGHFYAGSISQADKAVMLRIKSGEMVAVDTRVDEPKEVLKRLSIGDLSGGKGLISALAQHLFSNQLHASASVLQQRTAVFSEAAKNHDRISYILLDAVTSGAVESLVEFILNHHPEALFGALQEGSPCAESPWREIIIGLTLSNPGSSKEKLGDEMSRRLNDLVERLSDADAFSSSISDENAVLSWLAESTARIDQLQGQPTPVAVDMLLRLDAARVNLNNLRILASLEPLGNGAAYGDHFLGRLKASSGPLKEWLMKDVGALMVALLEQDGEIHEAEADVLWALNEVEDDGLKARFVERLKFSLKSIERLEKELWVPAAKALNVSATWGNIRQLATQASPDELAEVLRLMLNSEDYLNSLGSDVESLGAMHEQDVDSMIVQMLSLPEDDMQRMALFLGSSGAFGYVSEDFDPPIPDTTVQLLAETFAGDWMTWLLDKIVDVDYAVATSYLASCVNSSAFRHSTHDIPDDLAVLAALELNDVAEQWSFVKIAFMRVTAWDGENASRACWIIRGLVLAHPAYAAEALGILEASKVASVADVDSAAAVIAEILSLVQWVKVRALLVAASQGVFSALKDGHTVRVGDGDPTAELANVLHARGLIRKVSRSNGNLVLKPTAKF